MKVVIESVGNVKGRIVEGVALTPGVSLNRNIYSIEAIDNAKNLGVILKADWEHTDEIIGSVVYSKGPNHSILYRAEISTDRVIKEGVTKVSIEASVDDLVSSCNRKGCYNLVDGITFEGIGLTENPGVQTTTLNIVESSQEWPVITELHCDKCKNTSTQPYFEMINNSLSTGTTGTNPNYIFTTSSLPNQTIKINEEEHNDIKTEIENLKKEIETLKLPRCEKCHKVKKN